MERKLFTRRPELELKLHANEAVLCVMHRHIVHLLVRLVAPALVLLLSTAIIIFRAAGGQFFVGDAVPGGQTSLFDLGLVAVAGLALVGAFFLRRQRGGSIALAVLAGMFVAWLIFRLRGGRVISYGAYANQSFDVFNLALITVALIALAVCVYLYLDWKIDEFILTTHRVVYNSERPLVRREQEQIPLGNIQQVEANTETYIQHWLKLGTLQIKSAAAGFTLFFSDAYDPDDMQRRIMDQVKKVRRDETNADLQRLIESALDGKPNDFVRREREVSVERTIYPSLFQWLFPENPEIDREKGIYIWHPHWIFVVKAAWLPVVLWFVVAVIALATLMGGLLGPLLGASLLVVATLVFGAWAAWQVEDLRNDRYILTPTQIIDVNKKPFGPENRRTASLGALQNVTYNTTLIGRIFGYGDVLLQTAGSGDNFTFRDAPRPSQLVDVITSYQVSHKRSTKIRDLEDTVKLIQYYNAHFEAKGAEPRAREVGGAAD
jgi:hypothetical protein